MEEYQFLGENIWLGALQIFSPTDAIVAWYNETEFFDYDTLSCTKACGHYTQVRSSVPSYQAKGDKKLPLPHLTGKPE